MTAPNLTVQQREYCTTLEYFRYYSWKSYDAIMILFGLMIPYFSLALFGALSPVKGIFNLIYFAKETKKGWYKYCGCCLKSDSLS